MQIHSHSIFGGRQAGFGGSERFFATANNGSRAILIENSTIRWCDTSDRDYSFMPLVPSFDAIRRVVVSKGGEYVCLYNDDEFRVIEVPWGYSSVSNMARAFQKCCFKISDSEAKLKQVLFHPLAYEQETLVILRDDDSVTIANWKDYVSSNHVILNLSNGTFSLDSYIADIESIAFGMDGTTLYALSVSEGADIWAFYPCLPENLDASENLLDGILYKSLIQYEELTAETGSEVKKNTIKQLRFITKLRETQGDVKALKIPSDMRQVRGQGPFTLGPFPEQIYSCTGRAIGTMPIGDHNELLLMGLDDGSVLVMLQDLEPTMNWSSAGYNFNNSLVLLELVSLGTENKREYIKDIVVERNLHGRFSVIAEDGVFFVDTTKWSDILAKCLEESDLRPLGTLNFKSKVTFTQCKGTPTSSVLWRSNTDDCVVSITATEVQTTAVPEGCEQLKLAKKKSTAKMDQKVYRAPYSQPMDEIMLLSQRFQKELSKPPNKIIRPQDRQVPLKNDSNEIQLDLLTDYSKELFQKLSLGQSLGASLHNRLLEQVSDLNGQLKTTGELREKGQGIREAFESQATRIDALESQNNELSSRFAKLKDNLNKISESQKFKQLEINKQELAWFKEIKTQVFMFNQNVRNQQKLQEQLAFLKKELTRISTIGVDNDSKSREEWQELRCMLEEDTKILQECNRQLNMASCQVPANP